MNFTIPSTKNTKAIVIHVSISHGLVVAIVYDETKSTKGDECYFLNAKYGFSRYTLQNNY